MDGSSRRYQTVDVGHVPLAEDVEQLAAVVTDLQILRKGGQLQTEGGGRVRPRLENNNRAQRRRLSPRFDRGHRGAEVDYIARHDGANVYHQESEK